MGDKGDGVLFSFSIGALIFILYFSSTNQLHYTVALDNGREARRYVQYVAKVAISGFSPYTQLNKNGITLCMF